MGKILFVGVAGSSDPKPHPRAAMKAERFGIKLAEYRDEVKLLTGGDGGLMRVVSRAFVERGGETIGIIPLEDEGRPLNHPRYNPYNTMTIKTGVTFQARSIILVRSSDSFVILGGGAGTIIEAFLAYLYRIPLIVIEETGYPTDKLKELAMDGYLDHRKLTKAYFTEDPEEAAEKAYTLAKSRTA